MPIHIELDCPGTHFEGYFSPLPIIHTVYIFLVYTFIHNRTCQDCRPAAPAMLCQMPVCHRQWGERAAGRQKGGWDKEESKLLFGPSCESCWQFQGHAMECDAIQLANPGIVTTTICLNVIEQLKISWKKGNVYQMLWE